MRRRLLRAKLLVLTISAIAIFAFFSLRLSRNAFSYSAAAPANLQPRKSGYYNLAISEDAADRLSDHHVRRVSSVIDSNSTSAATASVSILLPDWEVLVIINNTVRSGSGDDFVCFFQNNATSPARFSGKLPSTNRTAFKCAMPNSVRRLRPFFMPVMTKKGESPTPPPMLMPKLYRWNFVAYESFSTKNDVVLFVKGVNNRQGVNRPPNDFKCVFYNDDNTVAVKTAVTSSAQEVFRCAHPILTAFGFTNVPIRVSLEMTVESLIVPSVAQYVPWRSVANPPPKSLLCACTMVYNAGKFLKEWVAYHSKIGVDKFILYDNDSSDNLRAVVEQLNGDGYDITTLFWIWPKAQEAGFSHGAIYAKDSCTWMMYADVDEFIFSPSWTGASSKPSHNMIKSLLPRVLRHSRLPSAASERLIGQVSIRCNEFGPSNQRAHPTAGVTQGYTCRRMVEQRHKSILRLDAVDPSLLNVVHHFHLSACYKTKTLSMERAVVNHYKYQAWTEFRNKFRRRVSTYVADWREKVNPASKDRTPGLGFEPVEPDGWARMFCEVKDDRLKMLTRRWFGSETSEGYKMAWEIS